jgi:hypothetical protein
MEELYRYNGLYMATDFAHFESHFEKLIFETIEFQLYDHMTQFLPSHKDFMALLRRVLCGVNVCKFRRLLVFIIAGRLSGEMNTSLGNGFTNLMLILYACKCSGIVKPPGKIEGDDSLFVIPHKIDSTIFEKCGFTIVINYFEKLEHASFCGMIFDRNALQNVTDPYKYLLNFGWLKENYVMSSRKTQMKLLLSRSISLLVTYPACPILTSLAKYGLRCSRRYKYPKNDGDTRYEKARLRDDYERFYTNKFSRDPIHLDTRFLVNDVFKIDIDTQLQIEKYLDSLDDVQPLEHPSITDLLTTTHRLCWQYYVTELDADVNFPAPMLVLNRKEMVRTKVAGRRNVTRKGKGNARPMARAPPIVRGSGAYQSRANCPPVVKEKRNLGSRIGGAIGNVAQKLFTHITGFGDYKIEANSLMGGLYNPPELHNRTGNAVVLRHREYVSDIVASSSFTIETYNINPGLVGSFPWLSGIAQNFEEYRITGMIFEYKTLSADYTSAASAALGYVVMATQYNVYNPVFPDKKTMENYEFSNSAKPSDTFIHPIECKRSLNPVNELYVRAGAVTSGDLRLYDIGMFEIATGGNSGTGILGELWVTFEIELFKPKLVQAVGYDVLTDHFQLKTITNSTPLGSTTGAGVSGSNIGGIISLGTTYTFPANIVDGQYLVNLLVVATSGPLTISAPTPTGCSVQRYWNNDTTQAVTDNGATNANAMYMFIVLVTTTGANFVFGSQTFGSAPTNGDLWVTQISGGIAS